MNATNAKAVTLHVECSDCDGTGIYKGFAEKDGTGAICASCKGTGGRDRTFTLFSERKLRDDVEVVVYPSHYSVGADWVRASNFPHVTYEAFLAGERPRRIEADEKFHIGGQS